MADQDERDAAPAERGANPGHDHDEAAVMEDALAEKESEPDEGAAE